MKSTKRPAMAAATRTVEERIGAELREARRRLRDEIERIEASLGITGTSHLRERGDLSEEVREDEESAGMAEALHRRFRELEEALTSIEEGTYGACLDCGRLIPRARRLGLHSAVRCTSCQEAVEDPSPASPADLRHAPGR